MEEKAILKRTRGRGCRAGGLLVALSLQRGARLV